MRAIIMIALLAVTLALAGCGGSGGGTGNLRTFIGGTEGVAVSFELESPPSEVNEGDPFYAVIILENKGEYTVPQSDYFVELKGFSPADFGVGDAASLKVTGTELNQDLIKNTLNPDTGEVLESYPIYAQIPLDGNLAFQGSIAGNTQFPFAARVCYSYKTTANAKLCIKSDLQKPRDTEVCTIAGPQAITSSAAPVQITDFKEFSGGPNAVRFTFKVMAAASGGKISELGSDCDHAYNVEDRILVNVDTDGLGTVSCNGFIERVEGSETAGYVKLSGGSRQISCTVELSEAEQSDYVKVITITGEYDYEQTLQTQVLVKPQVE